MDYDVPAAQAQEARGQGRIGLEANIRSGGAAVRYRYPAFVGVGVAASVLAALLGYAQKLPCSSGGAWNSFTGQFRDACYTDIYPLYYTEQLSAGKVPYYGHPPLAGRVPRPDGLDDGGRGVGGALGR